jgi:NADPH2:quinone reductase
MLAALYSLDGGPPELEVREIPTPSPGPGQVRVRVAVSGVNPTDWKTRKGLTGRPVTAGRTFQIPNQDGAGTIDAVGSGVSTERLGQRVWLLFAAHGSPYGTAAEYTVVPEDRAIPLPDEASFELGASLGVPALTAAYCLATDGAPEGRTVLVSGGAGAVGHAAIELARFEHAARVIATVSGPQKAALATQAGADTVVNYREAGAADRIREAAPDGVERFVEVAISQNLDLDLAVAAPGAVIVAYAADSTSVAQVPVRQLMAANIALRFMLLYVVPAAELQAAIARTSAALAAGALSTLPIQRFSLAQAAAAHVAVEQGALGKVVIDLAQP